MGINMRFATSLFLSLIHISVRVKLTKGEPFVGVSYDNQNRRFTGTIETDKGYGEAFSFDFLKMAFRRSSSSFCALAITFVSSSAILTLSFSNASLASFHTLKN